MIFPNEIRSFGSVWENGGPGLSGLTVRTNSSPLKGEFVRAGGQTPCPNGGHPFGKTTAPAPPAEEEGMDEIEQLKADVAADPYFRLLRRLREVSATQRTIARLFGRGLGSINRDLSCCSRWNS